MSAGEDMATATRNRVLGAAAILSLLGVAGCGGLPGASLALSSCTVGTIKTALCGSLSVLENPAKPSGRRIPIRVVVLPAYGSNRAPDPLFYFQGGPGGAATDPENVEPTAQIFRALNARHDLVFIDQRGTGGSNRMECPQLMDMGGSSWQGLPPTAAQVQAAAAACLEATARQGDPTMYTTPLFADDVDQVRAALGYTSIDLYGGSYGVSSALTYIQRHGDHVRTALLDSGSLLDVRLWQQGAASLQSSLDSVLSRCSTDPACRTVFPTLSDNLAAVLASLAAQPVSVEITDPRSGQQLAITVTEFSFLDALATFLSDVSLQAHVPAVIHLAYLGEWARLATAVVGMAQTDNPQVTFVMARTIDCSDGWAQMDPAATRAAGGTSIFTEYEVDKATVQQEFCAAWPPAAGASGPVRTSAPVVFLNGTADDSDPPANVAGSSLTMPNSLVVAVQGYGHGQLDQDSSGCLAREATAFIESGTPSKSPDWSCAENPPFPPFDLNGS